MKRFGMFAFATVAFAFAMTSTPVDAQSTPQWRVVQGENTGATECSTGHTLNENNLKSYASWTCGHTACTTVYTQMSCTTDAYSTVTASGLLNYKCCY